MQVMDGDCRWVGQENQDCLGGIVLQAFSRLSTPKWRIRDSNPTPLTLLLMHQTHISMRGPHISEHYPLDVIRTARPIMHQVCTNSTPLCTMGVHGACTNDPALAVVIAAWPSLSADIQGQILALIQGQQRGEGQPCT